MPAWHKGNPYSFFKFCSSKKLLENVSLEISILIPDLHICASFLLSHSLLNFLTRNVEESWNHRFLITSKRKQYTNTKEIQIFLTTRAWFIHRGHKPLVVPFSSSKLLSKLEKETFSCSFFIIKTFVKIGEGNL